MSTDEVLTARDGAVATVTVNRPTVLNALDAQTVRTLTSVMTELGQDDEIRCVVLTGAGDRAFIAGADITELARLTPTSARAVADAGHRLCALIEGLGKPVIAAINGFALGGGCEIAMACTLRIAATTAKLGQPEIALGLIPGFGGTQRLPRLVGRGRALEMLLTGAPIDAEEAWRIGLVNRVVPPAALADETSRLAGMLATQAPVAVRHILEVVHHGLDMSLAEAAVFEASTFGLVYGTKDAREGTTAFLEKRKPRFTGC
ncbi:MAG: enoyl-CoA hydratase [Acidobacteria bacterium]|nr:enoyl-CoA hydratase/isomerase family protein [Acidobacteriota bacterium]TDI22794.1 MAG: enoyl-CoA hydratase [Acidobacteriota bacterium]